ncbi:MAG: HTH domain-containing protein [Clostridia bacterium]|nr:HTH domain-containing protein [Clostridia bacterium]
MFEKNLGISRLLDFYGSILTDRKRDVLELYYNEDLSLGEIADNIGISRQGVRDLIKKAEAELVSFEET